MGIFINKEASKKLHCQVPPLPTCIALLISHSKALFESLHIWHLHVFFFFPHKSFGSRSFFFSFLTTPSFFFFFFHKSFGSRSFFFIFLLSQNQTKLGLFQPVSQPAMGDLCGFWLVSVQISAKSDRIGVEKKEKEKKWRIGA